MLYQYVLSHGVQPGVQRRAQVSIAQARRRSAALCMSAHDHLLHLQMRHGILDHARRADVVRVHAVGNVAVHEDVADAPSTDGRLGNAAVCAAYPQDLRPLALCEVRKRIRICLGRLLGEDAVPGDDAVDGI